MGFFDKVKKALGSKDEDVESQDSESNILKHDVFISYSTKDSDIANRICYVLEQNNLKCWIAPRNIVSGRSYVDEISYAIKSTKIVVLVFSQYSQESKYVNNEINLAYSYKKPILSFNIDNSLPKDDMQHYLKVAQWLPAYPNPEDEFKTLILEALKLCHGEMPIVDRTPTKKIRNFKYLDDLIHSGAKEIVLDLDVVLSNSEVEEYKDGIKLDVNDMVIDGNSFTVDARGKTRIFHSTGKNITIKNITLKNGFSKDDGGAIDNHEGELTIMESTLTGNTAGSGGAIRNEGELTITESILSGNTARGDGGAIRNSGELTISESTLMGNTAGSSGGAIDNHDKLIITKSTLTQNSIQETGHLPCGGAIINSGELTITESTLNNNTSPRLGGAIYNASRLTITESTLIENTAQDGGAIEIYKGNFKIFNCEFLNNKSPYIILNNDSLQIYNTTFKDNQSKYVVLNEDDEANLGIFNGEFSENNVEESVLCNTGKFCGVEKTVFQNNISSSTMNIINKSELTLTDPKIKDNGKSILNEKYILIKNSSPELENKICGKGTVENIKSRIIKGKSFNFGYLDEKIHERKTKEIILDQDITFENYEIDFYEGGIELDIDDLIINGNGHTIDGADKSRIFIITGKNITLKNIIFKNGHSHKNYDNSLNSNGGAIKINYNNNIIIENCEFINNTSEENGGAIYNNSGGELTITDSTLTENTAKYGGAIYNDKGELKITESTLTQNSIQEIDYLICGGGAIYNSDGVLTITDSTLNNNTSPWRSGAIDNDKGEATIMDSTIAGNTAGINGGAIRNEGELTITDSTLTGNTAGSGGAIDNHEGELTITDSTIAGNTAGSGGAIRNKGELTITDSILTENTAEWSGGVIYNKKEKSFNIKNCKLENNKPNDIDYKKDN